MSISAGKTSMRHTLRRTLLSALGAAAAAALLCTGCAERKTYRIAVSQCSQDPWREKVNQEIRREAMLHDNVEVEIRPAYDNNERQIADIRDFAAQDFDVLIVAPNQMEALTPVIDSVYKTGMPVIVFDRDIASDNYTAHIEGDNHGLGVAVARYAASRMAPRHMNIIEITGLGGSSPAQKRHEGFIEEVDRIPNATLLASADGRWAWERAYELTDSLLRVYPQANMIYAHNDGMGIGARKAIREHGLGESDIMIIGIDGTPEEGIQAVADGVIDATFMYPTDGWRLVRAALAVLRGEPFDRNELIPPTSAVDSTNADLMLQQAAALNAETDNIPMLRDRLDDVRDRHATQTRALAGTIAVLLGGLVLLALLVLSLRKGRKLQRELGERNAQLTVEQEKQKELYRQLEEATRSKMMFYTNISHDLRTPLTLIADPVEQVSRAKGLTDEQRGLMKIADRNVKILRRLINQLLDFRKYENDKLELNKSRVSFGECVGEWAESFAEAAKRRHITLDIDTGATRGTEVVIDVEKMERVVFNLLSNALKYTPANGTVTLTTAKGDGSVAVQIADTGQGIAKDEIESIFDRYYRVRGTAPYGSGIGLAVTKAFVELHNGTIEVDSTVGKGSVFRVTIPVVDDQAEAPVDSNRIATTLAPVDELDVVTELPVGHDPHKPLALVVEDNRDMQSLLSTVLSRDYTVICAPNGSQGVRMASKHIPDLIICDVLMPVMNGLECCSLLKGELPTSHIPVLMLTACTLDEQRVQGYAHGADSYLEKPFNTDVLLTRCRNLLDNRKRIRDAVRQLPAETPASAGRKPRGAKPAPGQALAAGMPVQLQDIDNDFYNAFLGLVARGLGDPELSIERLAEGLGLSQSQFTRKIKALTNYTPVALVRMLRMHEGRRLLRAGQASISEVAYAVGFTSPAYFAKCFQDAFGQTPTEFRNMEVPQQ